MNLIDRMQAHRDAGGNLFDCPSFSATPEEKAELCRATNALFNDVFKDFLKAQPDCTQSAIPDKQ